MVSMGIAKYHISIGDKFDKLTVIEKQRVYKKDFYEWIEKVYNKMKSYRGNNG